MISSEGVVCHFGPRTGSEYENPYEGACVLPVRLQTDGNINDICNCIINGGNFANDKRPIFIEFGNMRRLLRETKCRSLMKVFKGGL